MSPASPIQGESTLPGVSSRKLSTFAIIIWLVQLIFPTIGLVQFTLLYGDTHRIGRFHFLLLAFCLLWYAGVVLTLMMGAGRRWIAGHLAQIGALLFSLTIALVFVEVVCRTYLSPREAKTKEPKTKFSSELGWNLVPGVEWAGIGEDGWRKPTYPHAKAPGHFRILCVGDSTTYGGGLTWEEAYPHQLEIALNSDADWSKSHGITEVVNLGVPAYGPDQSLLALERYGVSYKPDVVIFHLCLNDFAEASLDHHWLKAYGITHFKPFFVLKDGRPVLGRETVPPARDAQGNIHHPDPNPPAARREPFFQLALVTILRDRMAAPSNREQGKSAFEVPEQYWPIHDDLRSNYLAVRPLVWALIQEMARVSRAAGASFLLSVSPTMMNAPEDMPPWRVGTFLHEYEEDAKKAGVAALNGVPEYFTEGGNPRFVQTADRFHLNSLGNVQVARSTFRWLKKELPAAKPPKASGS
jgi:lysophospholipase L1-like esterase